MGNRNPMTKATDVGMPEAKTAKPMGGYRCQFCGVTSPVKKWKGNGYECPECGRVYDAMIAQEEETE
jgi:DNA-directed RNA polymerase subunit RPC12/RpoP